MISLLQHWVTRQAEEQPDRIALVRSREKMTYQELEQASNRLARLLKDAGCRKGDRVCFLLPKSTSAIVGFLGALKADCIYVPLDASSPASRLAKIIDVCRPSWILAGGSVLPLLDELFLDRGRRERVSVGWLESGQVERENFRARFSRADFQGYSDEPLESTSTSADPAHLIFLSGPTGTPKGVAITHANVIHFTEWAVNYFGIDQTDRVSSHPPLHFDLSTFDLFGAFAAGAELHLVPSELSLWPYQLADFIRGSELTQWFSVPSLLNYLAKHDAVAGDDFPSLRRIIWCGEVFPTSGLIYWMQRLPKVQFTNLYGPTETTVASSYYTVPRTPANAEEEIPLGVACEGEELLILDESLQPAPQGEVGQLYIRGPGLSPGYWDDSEETEAYFLPDLQGGTPGDRIYQTGDLARVGEDGLFYFLGRADAQIKSRGYRIELEEVETALRSIEELEEGAIVAIETEGFERVNICCAYAPRKDFEVTAVTLRKQLSAALPAYMMPSRWMCFDRLPKNGHGKVDRKAIKEQFQQAAMKTKKLVW